MFRWGKHDRDVVERFVAALNAHDYDSIEPLIHSRCRMIDSSGEYVEGGETVLLALRRFLEFAPDFQILIGKMEVRAGQLLLRGETRCSNPQLASDCLWRARVEGGLLSEWQSFSPTSSIHLVRELMGEKVQGPLPGT